MQLQIIECTRCYGNNQFVQAYVTNFQRERIRVNANINSFNICLIYFWIIHSRSWIYIYLILFIFRCPRYPSLPSTCTLVYDPTNPCCKKPECTTTPAPLPGQSPTPGPNPTPSTQFCVYQGVPFRQGQTFNQGCDKICKCEDAMTGKITCDDR